MWESGKLDTRLMFCLSCQIELGGPPLILGQQQTNALAPADQKRGWLVMLSPLHVALSNIQVLTLLAIPDKLQLPPTSRGLSMQ